LRVDQGVDGTRHVWGVSNYDVYDTDGVVQRSLAIEQEVSRVRALNWFLVSFLTAFAKVFATSPALLTP